jgi:magnesium-transporting ATPase (P-type)
MLTGDAPLTALKVAQGIGLCTKAAPPLTLRRTPGTGGGPSEPPATFEWVGILAKHQAAGAQAASERGGGAGVGGLGGGPDAVSPIPLAVPGLRALAKVHDLCVLETVLDEASNAFHASADGATHKATVAAKALAATGGNAAASAAAAAATAQGPGGGGGENESGPCAAGDVFSEVDAIRVFARCSPHGKAKVIRALQRNDPNNHVLMCGDGGNDVGALKQADVGLALLSGYGNANTTDLGSAAPAAAPLPMLEGAQDALVAVGGGGSGGGSGSKAGAGQSAEEALNAQAAELAKRAAQAARLRKTLLAEKQKELSAKMPERLQQEVAAMKVRIAVAFLGV